MSHKSGPSANGPSTETKAPFDDVLRQCSEWRGRWVARSTACRFVPRRRSRRGLASRDLAQPDVIDQPSRSYPFAAGEAEVSSALCSANPS